jgi:AmmeMemoRadiSam system protein A
MEPQQQGQARGVGSADDHEAGRGELLRLARRTLHEVTTTGQFASYQTENPWFLGPAAVFVTLRAAPTADEPEGALRGCVGQVEADAPLYAAVQDAAAKAATIDPRFYPVTRDEVDDLSIEISILSPMHPINSLAQIKIGRDGLLIVGERRRGLLLPEVAVAYDWDARQFVRHLCRKAALPDDAWPGRARLYAFTTESFTAPAEAA